MASIKLTVRSNFDEASREIKEMGNLTQREGDRIAKFNDNFKSDSIDSFIQKTQRASIAMKATRGPLEAAQVEYRKLRTRIEQLITNGLDPQDKALKPLIDRYDKLGKEIDDMSNSTKKASRTLSLMDGVMVGLGAGALKLAKDGFRKLIDLSKESEKAASEAQEIYGKYSVVFQDVEEQAKSMAESLSSDFDLAGSTAQELLGNTGDLLTGFGLAAEEALNLSDQTNRLAIDLASFSNAAGGAEAVSRALTSAYSGEREALKTYGIVINETMVQARMLEQAQKGLKFETEQQAKIFATLALAQEQSKNAIGDYARTSDSAANVSRRLDEAIKESKEIFGEFVLEGATPAKLALAEFVTQMNEAARESKALSDSLDLVYGRRDSSELSAQEAVDALNVGLDEINLRAQRLRDSIAQNENGTERWQKAIAAQSKEALASLELEKESLEERISIIGRQAEIEAAAARGQKLIDEKRTEEEKRRIDAANKYATDLAALKSAYSKTEQGTLDALVAQIAYFESFKKGPMVFAVLDQLREKLNKLNEAGGGTGGDGEAEKLAERLSELNNVEAVAQQERLSTFGEFLTARMEQEGIAGEERIQFLLDEQARIRELETLNDEEKIAAEQAVSDQILSIEQDLSNARAQLREKELNAVSGFFGAMDELGRAAGERNRALAIMGKGFASAQALINSYLAFTQVLADPSFIGRPWMRVISGAAVLASGIAQQVNILNTPIPSAETGGRFVVPDSSSVARADGIGMRVNPGEEINVSPRGESGGRSLTVNAMVDKQVIWSITQEGMDSGEITVNNYNLRAG